MYTFKWILITYALLFIGCTSLREVSKEERIVQKVYEISGLTQRQIYDKAAEWMAKTYVSSKEVIQLKDPVNGKIIGKGVTSFTNIMVSIPCEYTISIESKDGRVRVTFENFVGLWGQYHNERRPVVEEGFINEIKSNLEATAESLLNFLKETKKNNW